MQTDSVSTVATELNEESQVDDFGDISFQDSDLVVVDPSTPRQTRSPPLPPFGNSLDTISSLGDTVHTGSLSRQSSVSSLSSSIASSASAFFESGYLRVQRAFGVAAQTLAVHRIRREDVHDLLRLTQDAGFQAHAFHSPMKQHERRAYEGQLGERALNRLGSFCLAWGQPAAVDDYILENPETERMKAALDKKEKDLHLLKRWFSFLADKLCSEVKENRALEKELDELDDELDGKDRENRRSKRQVDRLRTQLARQAAQNRRQRILNLVLLVSIFLVLVFCVCVFPDVTITLITRTNEMTQELRLTFVSIL